METDRTPSSPTSPGNFVREFNSLPDVPSWLGDPMFGDATQTAVTLRWRRPPPPLESLESTEGLRLRATGLRWRAVVAGAAKEEHTVAEEDGEWSQLELPAESGALVRPFDTCRSTINRCSCIASAVA